MTQEQCKLNQAEHQSDGPHRLIDEVVEGHLPREVPYPDRAVHRTGEHLVTLRRVPIAPSHPRHVALGARHVLIQQENEYHSRHIHGGKNTLQAVGERARVCVLASCSGAECSSHGKHGGGYTQ